MLLTLSEYSVCSTRLHSNTVILVPGILVHRSKVTFLRILLIGMEWKSNTMQHSAMIDCCQCCPLVFQDKLLYFHAP